MCSAKKISSRKVLLYSLGSLGINSFLTFQQFKLERSAFSKFILSTHKRTSGYRYTDYLFYTLPAIKKDDRIWNNEASL